MPAFAGILIGIGAWILYCGWQGIDPLKSVVEIIKNPANAGAIVQGLKKNKIGGTQPNGGSNAIVAFARAQIGKPYVFGASGPNSYDCSGLVKAAYAQIGIKLPHSATAQMLTGTRINRKSDLRPGDLVFPSLGATLLGDHVQIWVGNGNIIEAARPGTNVRERAPWGLPAGDAVRGSRPR